MAKIILQSTAIAVVVFILAAASLTIWRSFHPTNPPNETHGAQNSDAKDNHGKEDKGLLERTAEDPVAFFTLWLTFFTGILATFTIWLALSTKDLRDFAEEQAHDMKESISATRRAADAALKQAETSENELRVARRPWVGLSGTIQAKLVFEADAATVEFALPIKNGGLSPARGTFVAVTMLVGPIPFRADQSAIDAERVRQDLATRYGLPIYPDQVKDRSESIGAPLLLPGEFLPLRPTVAKAFRSDFLPWPTGTVTVWFPTLIGYQDEFGEAHASFYLLQFVSAENTVNFNPQGTIEGSLRFLGTGAPAAY